MSLLPVAIKVVIIVDNMILDFIWSLRKPKIKKNVIVQNIENGGIKVPHCATMVEVNRISRILWLLNGSNDKWERILTSLIKPLSLKHFTDIPLDDDYIKTLQIPFYEHNNSRQNPDLKW